MDVYIGTSGWSYGWNSGGNLDWYIGNSALNAVELNASFYRFPFRNQIAAWAKKGRGLHWCVKVHRFITHQHRFNEAAREVWQKFSDLFVPLDPCVDWYLFQAPPSMKDTRRFLQFFHDLPFLEKCVLEIRNRSLLFDDEACRKLQDCLPLVSVDSPDVTNRIFYNDVVYMRMHGRDDWYSHDYTEKELQETAGLIRRTGVKKVYLFFNNDHAMLKNAQRMRGLFGTGPGI